MTSEQLQQANKINTQIALIDEMEKEVERFKKTKFCGSLPTSINRYIKENPALAMAIVDMIVSEAVSKKQMLQGQWKTL